MTSAALGQRRGSSAQATSLTGRTPLMRLVTTVRQLEEISTAGAMRFDLSAHDTGRPMGAIWTHAHRICWVELAGSGRGLLPRLSQGSSLPRDEVARQLASPGHGPSLKQALAKLGVNGEKTAQDILLDQIASSLTDLTTRNLDGSRLRERGRWGLRAVELRSPGEPSWSFSASEVLLRALQREPLLHRGVAAPPSVFLERASRCLAALCLLPTEDQRCPVLPLAAHQCRPMAYRELRDTFLRARRLLDLSSEPSGQSRAASMATLGDSCWVVAREHPHLLLFRLPDPSAAGQLLWALDLNRQRSA